MLDKIIIHHHHHCDAKETEKILKEVLSIKQIIIENNLILKKMSEQNDKMQQQIADIQTSAENIAGDIAKLQSQISGGLTADEATDVNSKLETIATRLRSIADITPE